MPDQLLQFGGSLMAVAMLIWLVRKLELGPEREIRDEAEARRLAQEADHSFQPVEVALDTSGHAALLADKRGRTMLLRVHGTHHAARILTFGAVVGSHEGRLTIDAADRQFGTVTLDLGAEADIWEKRIGGSN
ncbi:hypothetical protein [Alteripontixanthobacter muriae]|uniref:hypothetical protein n=1 Tax=Alteripontixanthobacter muriae TaxID=2705546 RepID=UPI0015776F09|nr:hypothetical protein [Alteripontixanthobacter muriae]